MSWRINFRNVVNPVSTHYFCKLLLVQMTSRNHHLGSTGTLCSQNAKQPDAAGADNGSTIAETNLADAGAADANCQVSSYQTRPLRDNDWLDPHETDCNDHIQE
jgi:hypothetical protein